MGQSQGIKSAEETAQPVFFHIPPERPALSVIDNIVVYAKTRLHRFQRKGFDEDYIRGKIKKFVKATNKSKWVMTLQKIGGSNQPHDAYEAYMTETLELAVRDIAKNTKFIEQACVAVSAYCNLIMDFEFYAKCATLTDKDLLTRLFVDCYGSGDVHMEHSVLAMQYWFDGRGILQLVILGIMNEILKDYGMNEFPHTPLCAAAIKNGRALTNLQLRIMIAEPDEPSLPILKATRDFHIHRFNNSIREGDFQGAIDLVDHADSVSFFSDGIN